MDGLGRRHPAEVAVAQGVALSDASDYGVVVRSLLVPSVIVLLMGGCTRFNPAYGVDEAGSGAAESSSGATSSGSGESAGTTHGSAEGTSLDSDPTDPSESGDTEAGCDIEPWTVPAARDTFLASEASMCGAGVPCDDFNFGASPEGILFHDEFVGLRSHMLIQFDLPDELEMVVLDPPPVLELSMVPTPATFTLAVTPVFPLEWAEGRNNGQFPAEFGATWDFADGPEVSWWELDSKNEGSYDVVLDRAVPFPTASYGPIMPGEHIEIPIPPDVLLDAIDRQLPLDLDITQFTSVPGLRATTRESRFGPLLHFEGC